MSDESLQSLRAARGAWRSAHPAPAWLAELQDSALEQFLEQGFPGRKLEDWKYTSLRDVQSRALVPVQPQLTENPLTGGWRPGIDPSPAGVTVCHLSELGPDEALDLLGAADNIGPDWPLAGLVAGLTTDPLVIRVAAAANVVEPAVLHWHPGQEATQLRCSRVLITAGPNSSLSLLDLQDGGHGVQATITDVLLADGAQLDIVDIKRSTGERSSALRCRVARDARFRLQSVALGGTLLRNDVQVALTAPGAQAELRGGFLCGDREHVDNHTLLDHRAAHTTSYENYRGVLAGTGRGVFNGKVVVREDAQKVSSEQNNDNIVLSDAAEIDTKPELEIYADDVRCSHGATVGRLDDEALFFLRARGIGPDEARAALLRGFAAGALGPCLIPAAEDLMQSHLASALDRLFDQAAVTGTRS